MRQENGTPSLDLPSALAEMLMMDPTTTPMPGGMGATLPQYQMGGGVGPAGMPMMPMEEEPFDEEALAAEIQDELMEGLRTGEVTMEDLNLMVQAIRVAEQNPQMYLSARNLLIQRDIIEPEAMPEQYDPDAMEILSLVADLAQQAMDSMGGTMPAGGEAASPAAAAPAAAAAPGMQSLQKGGKVAGPAPAHVLAKQAAGKPRMVVGLKDAPVPIMAHEGEYVIPKNVVAMKGREFFDRMIEKYKDN